MEEGTSISSNPYRSIHALAHEDRTVSLICGSLPQAGAYSGYQQKFGRDPHSVASPKGIRRRTVKVLLLLDWEITHRPHSQTPT